jgi:hypothetical protein
MPAKNDPTYRQRPAYVGMPVRELGLVVLCGILRDDGVELRTCMAVIRNQMESPGIRMSRKD